MVEVSSQKITDAVAELFIEANCNIRQEIFDTWINALNKEDKGTQAREVIEVMIKNAWIAWKESIPICQDTGQVIVFVEQGEDIKIVGKTLNEAVNEGVEKGGRQGYLRKSVVEDPLKRDYEGSYGPAIVHHKIVPGEVIKITLYTAGCGCEQMSRAAMFPPCCEENVISEFIVNTIAEADSKPCPPTLIGIGIGGNLEESSYLARKALLRPINKRNNRYEALEKKLLDEINTLNIGPQGLGGKTTVLAVNIEAVATHRGNLPVAIAFNCHIGRIKQKILRADSTSLHQCALDSKNSIEPHMPTELLQSRMRIPSERGFSDETHMPTFVATKENENHKARFSSENTIENTFEKRLQRMAEGIDLFQDWEKITLPLTDELIYNLKAGDKLLLNGPVYTARDAAHRRLLNLIKENKRLPFPIKGQVIYYVGPTPPKPGQIIGSAGPTTSARMDFYTPTLLSYGLKGMIGKGNRNKEVIDAIKRHKAIYFITFAGSGALLAKHIVESDIIAFGDLGTEAVRRLELKDFPVIVATDAKGGDIFKTISPRTCQII